MPPKVDPRDWDRYFRPGAPRRSGPLRALANIILICVAFGILGGASLVAWSYRERARESAAANASQVETSNAAEIATRTTKALEATAAHATSAVAASTTPTASPEALVGHSSVTNGGNLRKEPVVSAETVIGQVCVGDKADILEERTLTGGALWYRIRVSEAGSDCTAQRVKSGSVGWVSSTLLATPTP